MSEQGISNTLEEFTAVDTFLLEGPLKLRMSGKKTRMQL
jgi:hypothetical protein